jgi:hypothetical protein
VSRSHTAPRLLLTALSFTRPPRATRDRELEVSARYREPESLAVTLSKALDAGADAVLATPTPALRAALAELRRPVPVAAVWPVTGPLEEADVLAPEPPRGARAPGAMARARRGITALMRLPARLREDLVATVPMRLELDAEGLPRRALRAVAIAAPVTDLALAAGHARFFDRTTAFVHARFGVPVGFETHNLGHLLKALRTWGTRPDFVVGPVDPCGRMMKPDVGTVVAELERGELPVLARELCAGGLVSLEEGAAFALAHGAAGLAPDLVDLDDVSRELRGLGRMLEARAARASS